MEGKDRAEIYWMCCTVAFSTRNKQSHLLAPSLVSQFHSAKEVQQQEKGQIFREEMQALRRSEANRDAVSSHRETSGGARPLQTAVMCFIKS